MSSAFQAFVPSSLPRNPKIESFSLRSFVPGTFPHRRFVSSDCVRRVCPLLRMYFARFKITPIYTSRSRLLEADLSLRKFLSVVASFFKFSTLNNSITKSQARWPPGFVRHLSRREDTDSYVYICFTYVRAQVLVYIPCFCRKTVVPKIPIRHNVHLEITDVTLLTRPPW